MQGRIFRSTPMIDSEGNECVELRVQPSQPMLNYYGLDDRDLDRYGTFRRRYHSSNVLPLNLDPANATYLVLNDFNWNDTILTGRYPQLATLRNLQAQVQSLKAINGQLVDYIKRTLINKKAIITEEVDLIKTVASARSDKVQKDSEFDGEPESGG